MLLRACSGSNSTGGFLGNATSAPSISKVKMVTPTRFLWSKAPKDHREEKPATATPGTPCAEILNCAPPSTPPPALRVSGKQPVFENTNLWTSDDCKRVLFPDHAATRHGEIFATATRDVHFLESAVRNVKKMVKCFFETKD